MADWIEIEIKGHIINLKTWLMFSRPFTQLAPAIGFLCGGLVALGTSRLTGIEIDPHPFFKLTLGTIAAALMNIYSNAVNQIFDQDIDRINKPNRPLPSAMFSVRQAWAIGLGAAMGSMLLASLVSKGFLAILMLAAVFTSLYSIPPFRMKRFLGISNLVIAIPRGCLVTVAGWSAVASVLHPEPWLVGSVLGLFILGAASTKDFSDIEGDRRYGCTTLPVTFGIKKSTLIIAPFLVLPFMVLPLYAALGWLNAPLQLTIIVGVLLAAWGSYVVHLLWKFPDELATEENHVSWKHMYLLMIFTYVGIALCYIIPFPY
ncbi:UbiA prenyltransferase family protein [bacterium]|nr:UbiA prenyltransferase family protein [candidate division CSSED10-310 bacterium]